MTVLPLAGIVRPLLPSTAEVTTLIPPGRSEHGYEFTARDVAALADADVVLYVGLGLEPQVESYLHRNPLRTRRDVCFATAVGIKPEPAEHHDHAHEDGHDHHDHAGPDPHLWLDPQQVLKLIPALSAAVSSAVEIAGTPAEAEQIKVPTAKLLDDVEALDRELVVALTPLKGQSIVTHHAAWARFAERYGLKVAAVIRPIESAEPTPEAVRQAVEAIQAQGVKAIFVEPQFNAGAADRIANEAKVRVGTLDPLGDGDWFKLMRDNSSSLLKALGP